MTSIVQEGNQRLDLLMPQWLADWGMTQSQFAVLTAVIQGVAILITVVLLAALMTFIERRVLAIWQERYGPNRVGPGGSLQIVADMFKMMFKEDWVPSFSDKLTFVLAPAIAMGTMLLSFAVLPLTPTLGIMDTSISLLFFMAMAGLSVYAVMFGAWSSNNKYALLGGVRSAAQTISYEVFMGLALMGIVAMVGSFNLRDIVEAQRQVWFIVPQILGFFTFAIAGVAATHRHPFDQPEAEQELADGYHIEYSGMKWGMFFIGEYVALTLVSALLVILFFGGWLPPFNWEPFTGAALQLWYLFWFLLKTSFFMMLFILIRASLFRPRYDQVMSFGWKICLPLTLVNLLVTAFWVVSSQH